MEYAILEKTVSCSEKWLALKMMESTCSYLRLKVTYLAFEDVGCIEVMGCVKKLSQTVPAGRDLEYRSSLEYWESTVGFLQSSSTEYRYHPYRTRRIRLLSPEKARPRSGILGSDRDPEDPRICCRGSHPSSSQWSGIRDPASS